MTTPIHTHRHTFREALWCKADNKTLSSKSLRKLTRIANREFGGRTEGVFGKGRSKEGTFNGDTAGLRHAISSHLQYVRSPKLRQVMGGWLARLPAVHVHAGGRAMHSGDTGVGQRPGSDPTQRLHTADRAVVPAAWHPGPAVDIPEPDYASGDEVTMVQLPDEGATAVDIPMPDYEGAALESAYGEDLAEVEIPPEDYDDEDDMTQRAAGGSGPDPAPVPHAATVTAPAPAADSEDETASESKAPVQQEKRKVHFSDEVTVFGQ